MKSIKVRQVVLGQGRPKICIPLVGFTKEEIQNELKLVMDLPCQVIEWRADYFLSAIKEDTIKQKSEKVIEVLGSLKMQSELPIIFTIRTAKEGGEISLSKKNYFYINKAVADTGLADLIDVQAFGGPGSVDGAAVKDFIEYAHGKNVFVILSNHDFEGAPDMEEMLARFFVMQELEGDVLKLAVMPRKEQDVVNLLEVTAFMRDFYAEGPLITMAMGEMGITSRICGGQFGSAVTFAAGKRASAPGQIDAVTLNEFIDQYYG